jgi:hypothetical protein
LTPQVFDLRTIGFTQGRDRITVTHILEPIGKRQNCLIEGGICGVVFLLETFRVDRFAAISNAEARFFELILSLIIIMNESYRKRARKMLDQRNPFSHHNDAPAIILM